MARIFPPAITDEDVRRALDELPTRTPYSIDGWATVTVDSDALNASLSVPYGNGGDETAARRRVAEVIRRLPELHARIVEMYGSGGPADGSDDHHLSLVDVEGDRIVLG